MPTKNEILEYPAGHEFEDQREEIGVPDLKIGTVLPVTGVRAYSKLSVIRIDDDIVRLRVLESGKGTPCRWFGRNMGYNDNACAVIDSPCMYIYGGLEETCPKFKTNPFY